MLQELDEAEDGTTLAVDSLAWAGPNDLLLSCSLWLHGAAQVCDALIAACPALLNAGMDGRRTAPA